MKFRSSCSEPLSHLAQVRGLLLPCWADLFSFPPPCPPLLPQAPESTYSWTPAVTSPPASCCPSQWCTPLQNVLSGSTANPTPGFFTDSWNWEAGEALRELSNSRCQARLRGPQSHVAWPRPLSRLAAEPKALNDP